MLLKFRFSLALGDIFQGVLLPTYYELFTIDINLEPVCIDHIKRHFLEYGYYIYNLKLHC